MTTEAIPPDPRIVLNNIRWETYEHLLADLQNSSAPRLAYDGGKLEIMSSLPEHEEYNRTLALLVEVLAEEWNLEIRDLGSTTLKRADKARGFEPDSCFYLQNAESVASRPELDLSTAPPPDLVIIINIIPTLLDRTALCAEMGVPEVWRYDGISLTIEALRGGVYHELDESQVLPPMTRPVLLDFVEGSKSLKRAAWLKRLREWARKHGTPTGSA